MSEVKTNIYQRIQGVIKEGLYIKRGSAGQGTGVLYDEVISVLTPILMKHGIVFNTEKVGDARSRANAKGNYIYECDFNVHFINVDNPEDRFTTFVEAHAMDSGDKAPGKAITYATKISLLKVFQIETGTNDESREEIKEKSKLITPEQASELAEYCFITDDNGNPQWSRIGLQVSKAYRINSLQELLASNFDAAISRCKKAAKNANNQKH
jgi:hypothetical protein